MQDFLEAVQTESDQVAAELQKLLSQLEPLVEKRLRLEQRARALQTVMTTYQLKGKASGPAIVIRRCCTAPIRLRLAPRT